METQHWLESAVDHGYVLDEKIAPLLELCKEIGRMLGGIMAEAELFCNPDALSLREEQAAYFATSTDD